MATESRRGSSSDGGYDFIQIAYREALTPSLFGVAAVIACLFVLMIAMIGPFDTHHNLTLPLRLVYSGIAVSLGLIVAYSAFVMTLYRMRVRTELQTILALTLLVLFVIAPCTTAIDFAVFSLYLELHSPPPVDHSEVLIKMYLSGVVLLVNGLFLMYYVLRMHVKTVQERPLHTAPPHGAAEAPMATIKSDDSETNSKSDDGKIRDRLPASIRGEIVFLNTDGHYLTVVTTDGTASILMRFRDAIRDLGDVGMQIHRCYWIAYDYLVGVELHRHRVFVRLTTGDLLPVSRSFHTVVKKIKSAIRQVE